MLCVLKITLAFPWAFVCLEHTLALLPPSVPLTSREQGSISLKTRIFGEPERIFESIFSEAVCFALIAGVFTSLAGCAIADKKSVANVDYSARVIELQHQLKRAQGEIDELNERNLVLERNERAARLHALESGEKTISAVAIPPTEDEESLPTERTLSSGVSIGESAAGQKAPAPTLPTKLPAKISSSRVPQVIEIKEIKSKQTGEHLLYSKVLETYRLKNSEELKKTIVLLLKTYPDSPFADNALYLDGLLAFEKGDYAQALQAMTRLIREYPNGNKAVSAMFAKGTIERRLRRNSEARESFLTVRKKFPGSPEAHRVALELKILDLSQQE
jgi:TolA-binding protein